MYQVIGIFLALIIGLLIVKAVIDIYKEGQKIDKTGWWFVALFVLDVMYNIWSVVR